MGVLLIAGSCLDVGCTARKADSDEKRALQNEISGALKVGDSELKLREFLTKQGWPSKYDNNLGGYYISINEKASFLNKHSVLISFDVGNGRITKIGVIDIYNSF